MLQIHELSKSYGVTPVLAGVSFVVNDGEHVALIGPNGVGKTTLLRCITGHEQPDAGSVTLSPPGQTLGYLPQTFAELGGRSVGAVVAAARGEWAEAEAALQRAGESLADGSDGGAVEAYDAALARFEALGGYAREHRAAAALDGLGLGGVDPAMPVASLSGGQQTRLGLAALLLSEPDLLLLDEPTNHLDVGALEWLEEFVRAYPRAALIVSHDRALIDRTVTRVLALDPTTHAVRSYPGGYSDFAAARAREREAQRAAWQDQQKYVRQVEQDIRRVKGVAQSIQGGPKRGRDFYGRVSAKVARAARARERKLERYLASEERVEKPRQRWGLKLDFGPPPPSGRAVLRLEDVSFAYPGRPPLLAGVNLDVAYGARIALVGPNGAGKTTLLRLIEGRLQPSGGRVRLGATVRLGVLAQEQETLDPARTLLATALAQRLMSETEARTFLHFFLFGGDSVFRRVGVCSMGERTRLQLALLVLRGCNLLLLDEPFNHLDIDGREHFEAALDAFEGTVIAVAHDRAFLRSWPRQVMEVRDGRLAAPSPGPSPTTWERGGS
jgi:ATPase subunit of ABC transporter with duplicated ATPase domains